MSKSGFTASDKPLPRLGSKVEIRDGKKVTFGTVIAKAWVTKSGKVKWKRSARAKR